MLVNQFSVTADQSRDHVTCSHIFLTQIFGFIKIIALFLSLIFFYYHNLSFFRYWNKIIYILLVNKRNNYKIKIKILLYQLDTRTYFSQQYTSTLSYAEFETPYFFNSCGEVGNWCSRTSHQPFHEVAFLDDVHNPAFKFRHGIRRKRRINPAQGGSHFYIYSCSIQ